MEAVTLQRDETVGFELRIVKDRRERAGVKGVDLEKAKAVLRDVEGVDVVADLKINVDGEACLFFMDEEMEEEIQ
jgi:hypothetical protein